jgi:ParB/RepB/Spo0J family partition protein
VTETTIQYIELTKIKPSKTNPRKNFDQEALKELAESIREQGIIQPLLVRGNWCVGKAADEIAKLNGDAERQDAEFFEIVAGERRYRAAGLASLATAPVIVRALGDQETLELQLIENLQRDDLDPFEEAEGYQRLLNLRDGHGVPVHTVDTIHRRVGKSVRRIYFRLKLLRAPASVRKAVLEKVLAVAIAEEIGSIPTKELREAAAEEILHPDDEEGPLSARRAREEVLPRYTRSLAGAPFDVKDASLVPVITDDQTGERIGGGACTDCPMRTGNMEAIIGKTKRPDVCTNPKCFLMKCDAQFARLQENAVKEGKRILTSDEVARNFESNPNSVNFGGLRFDSDFVRLTDKPDPHEVRQDFAGRMPHWKTLVDGLPETSGRPEITIARDPRGRIVELVNRELAMEAVNLAAKQKGEGSLFDRSTRSSSSRTAAATSGTGDAGSKEPAWKKQERKNREISKLNFEIALAAMTELIGKIDKQGAVKGFWDALIKISIDHAGHDGAWLICKRNALDPKKGKRVDGIAGEGVEGAALEYGLSLVDDAMKLGFVVELLLSQRVKIYNSGSMGGVRSVPAFKEFAKLYKVDVNEIEKSVRATQKEKKDKSSKRRTPNAERPTPKSDAPSGPYHLTKAVTLPGERQTYGVSQGSYPGEVKNPYAEHGLTKRQAEKRLEELNSRPTVVQKKEAPPAEHKWEKITGNRFRCKNCGASAVKSKGRMVLANEFRGKPCMAPKKAKKPRKTSSRGKRKGGVK